MGGRRAGSAALFVLAAAACELTEVTVPVGDPMVVVHGVLRPDRGRQFVLVEEAHTGAPPPRPPSAVSRRGSVRGIEGADVRVTVPAGPACGAAVYVLEAAPEAPGLYEFQGMCLEAGARVRLDVTVPDGRTVSGTTTVPEAQAMEIALGGAVPVPPGALEMHRGRHDLNISARARFARGIQVEARRPVVTAFGEFSPQDGLVFFLISDSLGMRVPGDLVNPFEGDSGEVVFRAGRTYAVTVGVADTNYYDFVRSQSDPFTGRGFINRLTGGIGVFGSLESRTWQVRVVDDVDEPREGVYQVTGALGGVAVDLAIELYVDRLAKGGFAAFVAGSWYAGPVRVSMEGRFGDIGGEPDRFEAEFPTERVLDSVLVAESWVFRGRRGAIGQPFPVEVFSIGPTGLIDTLTAVQVTGPETDPPPQ